MYNWKDKVKVKSDIRTAIIIIVVLSSIAIVTTVYNYYKIQSYPSHHIVSNEPSCSFMLYGEICSNVPQGGGGTLHAVYM